jgi:ribosomal protein S12 methylthiotransferase accessory factor
MLTNQHSAEPGPRVGFKHHLRAVLVPGDAAYLWSAQGVTTALRGRRVEALIPLLDGSLSLPELLDRAAAVMPCAEAAQAVAELARAGLIGYQRGCGADTDAVTRSALAYWDLAGLDGENAARQVAGARISLVAVGGAELGGVLRACTGSGLDATLTEPGDPRATFSLVVCTSYLEPGLRKVDAAFRASGQPWLLTRLCGAEPWVGPVFRPGESACWECLAHRLRGHRETEFLLSSDRRYGTGAVAPPAAIAATRELGSQTAVLEIAKWLAGVRYPGQDAVRTLPTLTMRPAEHPVQRRPQCPSCGDPALVAARVRQPVRPRSRRKATDTGSNDRALGAQQVWETYRHLVSPVSGVVTDLRPDGRVAGPLHCYLSGANPALRSRSPAEARAGVREQSGGKGVTAVEAKVSALCEAVERCSATWQGDEPVIRGSLAGLGADAVDPESCLLFHRRQYQDRDRWNGQHGAFQWVSAPFAADRVTDWTPVWSLTAGKHRLLPTSMLYFRAVSDDRQGGPWADSNGNAAGSSLEDAITQGFLELVERDAVALWWYNRTRHPAVDLDAFDAPWLARIREQFALMGRQVWALDVTSDLGIPTTVALSRLTGAAAGRGERIAFGFGSHFDPRLAMRRAVCEMAQLLPALDPQPPGDAPDPAAPELTAWRGGATVDEHPYLLPDPGQRPRAPGDFGYRPRADLADDIRAAERLVRREGMELLVLDQTRPDVGLPVVKVIVPGMRHFWARYAPGRLYDVPVRTGLLTRPTSYEQLNPLPLFV